MNTALNIALITALVLSVISFLLSCYVCTVMERVIKPLLAERTRRHQESKEESDASWSAAAVSDEATGELETACKTVTPADEVRQTFPQYIAIASDAEAEAAVATIRSGIYEVGTKADVVRQNPVLAVGYAVSLILVCSPKMTVNIDDEDDDNLGSLLIDDGISLAVITNDLSPQNAVEFRLNGRLTTLLLKV